ncbi:putative virulence plasmid b protein [Fusarium austroafricanum]|uniref:Putative virulence plasmid b protein n=1 Tax=Fusarium austroafricanum TaxID=2364996 RepID=A0A8H4P4N1_9HYPO|nr:putative virulence plasmid b protein [Fusarium austroafricanum]
MSLHDYQSAVDRPVGKADADSAGLARYSLKIQVPPGPGQGNEPDLSLQYSHGCSNGSLGLGWALGGLSCIRRTPSNLAYDGANTPPADYMRFESKLSLDEVELLNVKGRYGDQDAEYTTEIDDIRKTVTHFNYGFLVRDCLGFRKEYGTSQDSRIGESGEIREWRLKRQIDRHGNAMTFTYATNPRHGSSDDVNTCYLTKIRYSSNIKTGHPAARIVKLEYASRPDPIVQTAQGTKAVWASLLTAIRIGVIHDSNVRFDRSYELAYMTHPDTGDSCPEAVTETAGSGEEKISLLPHRFGYMTGLPSPCPFEPGYPTVANLYQTVDNVTLFVMNISGRGLPDIACLRWNQMTNSMSVKTYMAMTERNESTKWIPPDGPGFEAPLPALNLREGFPSVLTPDLNNDGRSDLIIPYSDGSGMLRFSMSQSLGTGFTDYYTKTTRIPWAPESKFMAMDLTGYGTTDVVQIFSDGELLSFRSFRSVIIDGKAVMRDGKPTHTTYDYAGTIDWFQLCHAKTGATSLVRVWAEDTGKGTTNILATTFSATQDSSSGSIFDQGKTSVLWKSARIGQKKYHVIPCDINADGVQDIVLATAEYQYDEMVFEYTTFLSDGQGSFERHKDTVTRRMKLPKPLAFEEPGGFHMSNLNGSNYPSICYIYRERNKPSYSCLTVEGLANGLVGDLHLSTMEGDMPSKTMEVVATDLNGNGIGDWLFHTIENDQPRIVPFYNQRKIAGLLEWSIDPMGLKTNFSYGTLSDSDVYTPAVSWKDYNNDSTDSYPVLGAPNYVVTALEHRNSYEVNSLPYEVTIRKKYASATVSSKGRGWQSFGTIHTLNMTDGIEVIDDYHSAWPFTGQKRQTTTRPIGGTAMKTDKVELEMRILPRGPWKTYSTSKVLEQIDMLDEGLVSRSNINQYSYDEFGNVTSRRYFEKVHGTLTHESWQRFAYTSINGITGLLTHRKVSSSAANSNMSRFEQGDASLVVYKYDETSANLVSESEWSTDVDSLATKTFTFDLHGNEVKTVDAAGLQISTTYDDKFKFFPVKMETTGPGISSVQLTAFDEASGLPTAKMEEAGSLECCRLDPFGRILEARLQCVETTEGAVSAQGFLSQTLVVGDSALLALLPRCHLSPYRLMKSERQKSAAGKAYITKSAWSISGIGANGRSEDVELVDCVGNVHKRFVRHGDEASVTAMFWDYDSTGHRVFETFPTSKDAPGNLDWVPDRSKGLTARFDALGRPTLLSRPAHGDETHRTLTSTEYRDGSTRVFERILRASQADTPVKDATQLSLVVKRYVQIDGKEHITEVTNENNLRSTFAYDVTGNMVLAVDPAGNEERRTYNSKGNLTSMDNLYQNNKGSSAPVTYRYDVAGNLVSESNGAGEVTTFKRDAKGRPLEKKGQDGRTIVYSYTPKNSQQPSIVTVYAPGSLGSFESHYEFDYDGHGNETNRTLTLGDGKIFHTQLSYDWQGRVTEKVSPDGAIMKNTYRGDMAVSSILSGTTSTWNLRADLTKYNLAAQGPEKIDIRGTGISEAYEHEWKYDALGFPLSHTLQTGTKSLVQEHYKYNDLDQMSYKHDFVSGATTEYCYNGRRLQSSVRENGTKTSYEFDTVGNILSKDNMSIAYTPGQVKGTTASSATVDVLYDAAGRMINRSADGTTLAFDYDSFGRLRRYENERDGMAVDVSSDFTGITLQKRYPDGSSELRIDDDFSIFAAADGSYTTHHKLLYEGLLVGTVSNKYESFESTRPLGNGHRAINVPFTDTKGNVTHLFRGDSTEIEHKYTYDDFGMLLSGPSHNFTKEATSSTYEGNSFDDMTGLLDLGGRWYDPLIGRFTSPDDILEMDYMIKTDGLNRYAFENNDPINHIDPTGHWSWSSILGVVIGSVMVVAAIGLTIATGGAAGILMGAVIGALASGGIAGIKYSVEHQDETDDLTFWGGFGMTFAINATIGAVTGALGAAAGGVAKAVDATARVVSKITFGSIVRNAITGAVTGVAGELGNRFVSNTIYGTNLSYRDGIKEAFAAGALAGGVLGVLGVVKWGTVASRSFQGWKGFLGFAVKESSKSALKDGLKILGKEVLKNGGKLGSWALKRELKN